MRRSVEVVFFFSSRRRHTRFDCDWSSDVCSSDLQITRHTGVSKMCGNPGAHSPGAKNCNFIYVLHANTLPNDIGHGAITKDFQLSIRNWQSEIQGHNAADSSRPVSTVRS